MKKLKRPSKKSDKTAEPTIEPTVDYEQLGRMMVAIVESGYMNRKQLLKMSFLRGAMAGLGGVLAASLLVALLVWILSLFVSVPLIGPWLDTIRETVESGQTQ